MPFLISKIYFCLDASSVLSVQKHYELFFPPAGPASQLGWLWDREEHQVSVLLACHVVDSCRVRRTVSLPSLDLLFWSTLFLVGWQSRANSTCVISWTSFVASLLYWSVEISYWLCDKNCKCKLCHFSVQETVSLFCLLSKKRYMEKWK